MMFQADNAKKRAYRALAVVLAAWVTWAPAGLAQAAHGCDPSLLDHISGTVILPANCTYQRSIRITDSNTTLDCQGSTFEGDARKKIGLMIDSEGQPLSNVQVKNCRFVGFASSAIRITWDEVDSAKGKNHKKIYDRTPTGIVLDGIEARDNGGVGIYLDDYVTNVTLKNSTIAGSRAVGVYLEHSSKQNRIVNNTFSRNGYRDGKKAKREAIAIDSSGENIIENNIFEGNAAGGIFFYKNCGEHFSSGKQVLRWKHSNHNIVSNNTFIDERVGIWLASRKGMNLSNWDCGDAPIDAQKGLYADFADFNTIRNNAFCRTGTAIINNGKKNTIAGTKVACPAVNNTRQ